MLANRPIFLRRDSCVRKRHSRSISSPKSSKTFSTISSSKNAAETKKQNNFQSSWNTSINRRKSGNCESKRSFRPIGQGGSSNPRIKRKLFCSLLQKKWKAILLKISSGWDTCLISIWRTLRQITGRRLMCCRIGGLCSCAVTWICSRCWWMLGRCSWCIEVRQRIRKFKNDY